KTELRQAEAKGARFLEQARHQATELTNSARAEVEATLEWARAQTSAILARAQHGAEQLLGSAGLREAAGAEGAGGVGRPPPGGQAQGAEPVAREARKGAGSRSRARQVPDTDEAEDASTPDDGSGDQVDR